VVTSKLGLVTTSQKGDAQDMSELCKIKLHVTQFDIS